MKGTLYILPTILAEETQREVIPLSVVNVIKATQYFLCENIRTARRFVSSLKVHDSIESLHFELLDKDTPASALPKLFEPIMSGSNMGVLSESGCAGVADPGAAAAAYAHVHGVRVIPMVGPSSILLALMASGLNGQRFAFHGYLPIDSKDAAGTIRLLEQESREKNQTQIFIETPYRNNALLAHLLKSLKPDTKLCVAISLTSPIEKITCLSIAEWKKLETTFEKAPAIFLFLAAS
jgi:16S rRNA (cytidine1402-2'-O)-methyltransferase